MTWHNPARPKEWQTKFVNALSKLATDGNRAILAQLRRGRGKAFGHDARRDSWVLSELRRVGFLRQDQHDDQDRGIEACCLIASLFAEHPKNTQRATLGSSFHQMATLPGASEDAVERRFHPLLDSDSEDLSDRLRQAISLLKSKDISINWAQLLADVLNWNWPSRSVQKAWARDFWAASPSEDRTSDHSLAAAND